MVGPAVKAAIVHHRRDKKDDDKQDNEIIEHKGAPVVAHRRRHRGCTGGVKTPAATESKACSYNLFLVS